MSECPIHDTLINIHSSYIETLSEPTPYDTVIRSHCSATSEVVPDLLQFSRPLLDLSIPVITVGHTQIPTIASDSASTRRSPGATSASNGLGENSSFRELSSEMLMTMTKAMRNLTTNCKTEESKQKLKDSIIDIENTEGNKYEEGYINGIFLNNVVLALYILPC